MKTRWNLASLKVTAREIASMYFSFNKHPLYQAHGGEVRRNAGHQAIFWNGGSEILVWNPRVS